jgi:glycosyltransferase involved in cell wall biosynthesis
MSNGITNKTRVAFLLLGGKEWLGGYNYLRNLCTALVLHEEDIIPVVFVGNDVESEMLEPFVQLNIEIHKNSIFDRVNKNKIQFYGLLFGKFSEIENVFKDTKIDVIFEHNIYFGWRIQFPVISWIPDFQHKHLAQLFPKMSWAKREIGLQIIIRTKRSIMLSSNDAKKDCQKFYNVLPERIYVVPFAVEPPEIDKGYLSECLKKYNIKQDFFYLPNQFWRHKNHAIVISALEEIRCESKKEILIISSGSSKDSRKSSYFREIESLIKIKKLENSFKLLGIIPYKDVIHLMYASCAVINPSYFEGWSTTVEEAKSLKKKLVVSNLNVHKEQLDGKASFFNPDSCFELADRLLNIKCSNVEENIDNSINVKNYAHLFSNMIQQIK